MRVELLTTMAGPGGSYQPGAVLDCGEEQAINLVQGGFAVLVVPVAERAVAPPAETREPLDHDGNGARGGSLPGAASTAAKGARRRAATSRKG